MADGADHHGDGSEHSHGGDADPRQHHHPHPETGPRGRLERGAGAGKLLFFDCFSGVAGDMTIAALLDLGVPIEVLRSAISCLPIDGYELVVERAVRSGIAACRFDVRVGSPQPQRTHGAIDDMLAAAPLEAANKRLARAIFRRLGEAEAHVHQVPLRDVHFHEVGAVDAIVDVVGAAAGLAYLGAQVVVSPLPLGRGLVEAQHGVLPLPAPATLQCLRGVPTEELALDVELVTPTGAAIVGTVAERFSRWPAMTPEQVGYGAGTLELPDRPNLLRLVLGEPSREADVDQASHRLIEANVDDLTGELAGHAIAALMEAGAVDAWAVPATMKKGRPGLTLAALAPSGFASAVSDALLRETTTIGVRSSPVWRVERPRTTVEVSTRFGLLPLKVSAGPHGPAQVKPEFDACAAAAREHGVPVRLVLQEALSAYHAQSTG